MKPRALKKVSKFLCRNKYLFCMSDDSSAKPRGRKRKRTFMSTLDVLPRARSERWTISEFSAKLCCHP